MNTFISFIVVLGILIFAHEFGHFLWAKIFRVRVLKFSLGFGPRLIGWRYGDTEYVISAFPLGGYVKMLGESRVDEELDPAEEQFSFSLKPVWQRFIIVAGGPVFNLLLAVLLFFIIFAVAGLPVPIDGTKVGDVSKESAAAEAGIKPEDRIVAINGIETRRWEDVSDLIKDSGGKELQITLERDSGQLDISVKPRLEESKNIFGEAMGERFMIGIARSEEVNYEKVSLFKAFSAGVKLTIDWVYLTILGIIKLAQKVIPASEIGGPIMIAQIAGKQMEAGWINFVYFMAVLSVNLGVLNLLPVPILDGGHLAFFSMEAIMRKPLNPRTMEVLQQVGLVLLGTLMIFVFYNDLVRVFG